MQPRYLVVFYRIVFSLVHKRSASWRACAIHVKYILTSESNWHLVIFDRRQCSSSSLRNRFGFGAVNISIVCLSWFPFYLLLHRRLFYSLLVHFIFSVKLQLKRQKEIILFSFWIKGSVYILFGFPQGKSLRQSIKNESF